MHLRALRYLVAVADEGHFGRAAARMHVSQPSISQAVSRLEDQFGVRLLDRSDGRVLPTEAGARVLAEVRTSLRHLDRARDTAGVSASGGRLRLACKPFLSLWLVTELLTPFREAHPDVVVTVAELETQMHARVLLSGEVDLAVGDPLPPDARLRDTTIGAVPGAIWMSVDHPLTRFDEVPLSALAGVLIADPDPEAYPVYGPWVHATLQAAGVQATFAPPIRDTPTGLSRIIDGTLVSLGADVLADGAIPGIAVRRVRDPIRWRWAATALDGAPSDAALRFTAWAIARSALSEPPGA